MVKHNHQFRYEYKAQQWQLRNATPGGQCPKHMWFTTLPGMVGAMVRCKKGRLDVSGFDALISAREEAITGLSKHLGGGLCTFG